MARLDFAAKNLPADAASAAVSGLIAIPDAIASAILAGVSPTFDFNALMTGVPVGSLIPVYSLTQAFASSSSLTS